MAEGGKLPRMSSSDATPLYDSIGVNYDATRRADPYLTERLAHHIDLQGVRRYLDIACGTGNYTSVLAASGGSWHGLDLSMGMLRTARRKDDSLRLVRCDAAAMPFSDRSFDGIVCTMALHHLPQLEPVFSEALRVLDRGNLVIFTGTRDQVATYWLYEYFPVAMAQSTEQMPTTASVTDALEQAGFLVKEVELYEVQPDLQDLFLYAGKRKPQLYLDETVRRGMSTFSTLIDPVELETGCARLRQDVDSGHINEVIESYLSDKGDYLFVVASRP